MRALKIAAGVAVALLLIAGGVGVAAMFGYGEGATGDGAIKACQREVETKLKSPRSAQYSDEVATPAAGDNAWTVNGNVDSENEFGANLRKGYECTAASSDGESWTVDAFVSP